MTALRTISPTGLRGGTTLVLLHGIGADERDLLELVDHLDLDRDWDVLSVRAPLPYDETGGASWFPIEQIDPDEVFRAVEQLRSTLDELVPTAPIVPLGFSQGAVMAGELLRDRSARIPAAVLLSGFVLPPELSRVANDEALTQRRVPVFYGWGVLDASPIPQQAFVMTEHWLAAHTDATTHRYPMMGHEVTLEELAHIRDFLNGATGSEQPVA